MDSSFFSITEDQLAKHNSYTRMRAPAQYTSSVQYSIACYKRFSIAIRMLIFIYSFVPHIHSLLF
jgi:hypothetical protein